MSDVLRNRFNTGDPFPKGGIVTPNVFPDPDREDHGSLDLHDILDGRIPKVRRGQPVRQGWLRIAFGGEQSVDYTAPGTVILGERSAREIDVDVEDTTVIRRVSATINQDALDAPTFNGRSFRFAEGEPVKITPVEHAIAFSGIARINDADMVVQGIHFASGQENGWLHIGSPVEPLDPAA